MDSRYLLSLIAMVMFRSLVAQTPIEQVDFSPVIGETFVVNAEEFVDTGDGGMDQVWDLSSLDGDDVQFNFSIVDPAATPFAANFPTSNYVISVSGSGFDPQYSYISTDNNRDVSIGQFNGTYDVTMTDPQSIWHFPMAMGNSFSDAFNGDILVSGTVDGTRSGNVTSVVDGHGTLMLPYGTFEDVYRVTTTNVYSDVTPVFTYNYVIVTSYFVKAGIHNYLAALQTNDITGSITQSSQYGYVLDASSVGIEKLTLDSDFMSIYPNPIHDMATLKINGDVNEEFKLEIYDIYGSMIEDFGNINSDVVSLDFTQYASGMYLIKITSNQASLTKRVVIQ